MMNRISVLFLAFLISCSAVADSGEGASSGGGGGLHLFNELEMERTYLEIAQETVFHLKILSTTQDPIRRGWKRALEKKIGGTYDEIVDDLEMALYSAVFKPFIGAETKWPQFFRSLSDEPFVEGTIMLNLPEDNELIVLAQQWRPTEETRSKDCALLFHEGVGLLGFKEKGLSSRFALFVEEYRESKRYGSEYKPMFTDEDVKRMKNAANRFYRSVEAAAQSKADRDEILDTFEALQIIK